MPDRVSSLRFADTARRLAAECRARGLAVPAFRSPPGPPAADRTVRRRPDGGVVVSVRIRGRPSSAVVADLVDGVIVANRLSGPQASEVRSELLAALSSTRPARAA
jgi:hypothetical protein